MTSAIDATKPADAVPASKADLRANLATAKSEIEAIQAQIGTLSPYVFNGQRNRLLNGRMVLDTRNAGAAKVAAVGANTFGADRWYGSSNVGGGTFTMQAITTGGPTGFPGYTRLLTTIPKVLVAADAHTFSQAVEGYHWADLLYGSASAITATLSFWVRASVAGNYAVCLSNTLGANTYIASYTVSIANTWEYKTITIAGPTSGTWATLSTAGVGVRFDLGCGSTAQGPTDIWAAAARLSYAGATSMISTNGATLDLTGVQLEPGSVATPWENRLIASEYQMTQRYFQAGAGARFDAFVTNTAGYTTPVFFTPYMRATPTILTNLTINTAFPVLNPTVLNGNATGFYGYLVANATAGGQFVFNWSADAEITI
jgi:hypothetical protein